MRKKHKNYLFFVSLMLLMIFVAVGCTAPAGERPPDNGKNDNKDVGTEDRVKRLETEKEQLQSQISELENELSDLESIKQASLLSAALSAVEMLKEQDMSGLSAIVHPVKGVRFTAYPYVNLADDLVFTSAQLPNILQDTQIYTWGSFDGTGDPILKTFGDYFDRFVYSKDFANPHMIGNNITIGTGNSINNISEAYPDGMFVEFHFKGFDPQYEGIDWRSLRLVFENMGGLWYLVGIVHGEWTI